jgi:hypothetical protein
MVGRSTSIRTGVGAGIVATDIPGAGVSGVTRRSSCFGNFFAVVRRSSGIRSVLYFGRRAGADGRGTGALSAQPPTITRRDHAVTPVVGPARCVPPAQGHERPVRAGLRGASPRARSGRLGRSFSRSIGAGKGLFTQQKISAPGGSRTHTEALLRGLPLPIGLRGRADSVRADPNRWEKCAIRVAAIAYRVLTAVNRSQFPINGPTDPVGIGRCVR